MKKLTTLALAGAMAVSSLATASMSRQNGFGLANQFIIDVQSMWTLPAVAASNGNATYFEFGGNGANPIIGTQDRAYNNFANPANAWGGANGEVGPGVLAIWGGRP